MVLAHHSFPWHGATFRRATALPGARRMTEAQTAVLFPMLLSSIVLVQADVLRHSGISRLRVALSEPWLVAVGHLLLVNF